MLNGKGMVNFSEGHFFKAAVVGHWGLCDGECVIFFKSLEE